MPVAQDLLDTLTAHKDGCVGMAANMIGVSKRIIIFDNEGTYMVMFMFNPEIVKKSDPYLAAGTAGTTAPQGAGYGAVTDRAAGIVTVNLQ